MDSTQGCERLSFDAINTVVNNDNIVLSKASTDNLQKVKDLKVEGNGYYSKGLLTQAIEKYTEALEIVDDDQQTKSILHSNLAACHVLLKQWDKVIENASLSLEINPNNEKSLARRAMAYENEDKLQEAADDLKKLSELNASHKSNLNRIEQKLKAKAEKDQEEMIGQLKDMGNKFLGMFGLSLNNFKTEKDESTGGYKINFQQ